MKKTVLGIFAIVSALTASAQTAAPDFNFETWAAVSPPFATMEDPQGWASLNALNVVGTPISVTKETASPYSGAISCKISTVDVSGAAIPNPFRPGFDFDTAGFIGIGSIVPFPSPSIEFGYTYSPWRPAMLSFASKYTPVSGDSAFVFAYLTRWNGTSRDTIADGIYSTGATTTSYSVNTITMNYKPAFST
ncbi:MAG: hypothetical protein M3R27_14005, partial [Bacteroidota bacterium]|nr:hypothetical protein [Bacteroidota bacterium]